MLESLTEIFRNQRSRLRGIYFGVKRLIEKCDRTVRQGWLVGYKNTLKFNEDLATAEGWSVAQIASRTRRLVNQTMALFDMGG